LAAVKEFFSLSPIWLRAATGFSIVALFALFISTVALLKRGPGSIIVERQVAVRPSDAELDDLLKVREQEIAKNVDGESGKTLPVNNNLAVGDEASRPTRRFAGTKRPVAQQTVARRRSGVENEQLLADLGVITNRDEEQIPRLSDILEEPEANF
jgi:hypothetical protein